MSLPTTRSSISRRTDERIYVTLRHVTDDERTNEMSRIYITVAAVSIRLCLWTRCKVHCAHCACLTIVIICIAHRNKCDNDCVAVLHDRHFIVLTQHVSAAGAVEISAHSQLLP